MPAPYKGTCRCGEVTISITAEPVTVRQCWCRQCQIGAGGGAAHNAIFPADAVTVTGKLAASSYTAASGNEITTEFCAACGTPVLGHASARPQFRVVRLGMIEPGHGLRPQVAIWTGEAPEWAVIDPELEQFEGQPPPPTKR